MIHLLDTGVWLRALVDPESLPKRIRDIFANPEERFGLSAISLWEVGKKNQIGKLDLTSELGTWLTEAAASPIEVLPLTPSIVADAMVLPSFPNKDPADEIIVATARVHDLVLLTTDTKLKGYRHARVRYFAFRT